MSEGPLEQAYQRFRENVLQPWLDRYGDKAQLEFAFELLKQLRAVCPPPYAEEDIPEITHVCGTPDAMCDSECQDAAYMSHYNAVLARVDAVLAVGQKDEILKEDEVATGITINERTASRDLTATVMWKTGPQDHQYINAAWSSEHNCLMVWAGPGRRLSASRLKTLVDKKGNRPAKDADASAVVISEVKQRKRPRRTKGKVPDAKRV